MESSSRFASLYSSVQSTTPFTEKHKSPGVGPNSPFTKNGILRSWKQILENALHSRTHDESKNVEPNQSDLKFSKPEYHVKIYF